MALKTMATLGDSITEMGTDASDLYKTRQSYATYAEALTNGAFLFRPTNNKGVSSETIAQIAARCSQVTSLSPKPDYCFVLAGMNDLLGGTASTAQALADAIETSICDVLSAASVIPIVLTIPPASDLNATQAAKRIDLNEILRTSYPYAVADGASIMEAATYPDDVTGGATYDGTHPEPDMHYFAYGRACAATFLAIDSTSVNPVRGTNVATIDVSGTGGALVGATGAPPDDWTFTSASLNMQGQHMSGWMAPASVHRLDSSKMTIAGMGLSVGDRVYSDLIFDYAASANAQVLLTMSFYTSGDVLVSSTYCLASYLGSVLPKTMHGRFRIGDAAIPPTTAKIALQIQLTADASLPTYVDLQFKGVESYEF